MMFFWWFGGYKLYLNKTWKDIDVYLDWCLMAARTQEKWADGYIRNCWSENADLPSNMQKDVNKNTMKVDRVGTGNQGCSRFMLVYLRLHQTSVIFIGFESWRCVIHHHWKQFDLCLTIMHTFNGDQAQMGCVWRWDFPEFWAIWIWMMMTVCVYVCVYVCVTSQVCVFGSTFSRWQRSSKKEKYMCLSIRPNKRPQTPSWAFHQQTPFEKLINFIFVLIEINWFDMCLHFGLT